MISFDQHSRYKIFVIDISVSLALPLDAARQLWALCQVMYSCNKKFPFEISAMETVCLLNQFDDVLMR